MSVNQAVIQDAWRARLSLGFEKKPLRTILNHREHYGPLRIQRPFYPEEDGTSHVYLIHPPGGIVGGDQLMIDLDLSEAARALITTPGATQFYRSNGMQASQLQNISLEKNAVLEWMPQETILFQGADALVQTTINLHDEAQFIGWDIACFGRPAAREVFDSGKYIQKTEIWQEGKPLWIDCCRLQGGQPIMDQVWGLDGAQVYGTFIANKISDRTFSKIQQLIDELDLPGKTAITKLDSLLVARYLGSQAQIAKRVFIAIWDEVRQSQFGKAACTPRIWNT